VLLTRMLLYVVFMCTNCGLVMLQMWQYAIEKTDCINICIDP